MGDVAGDVPRRVAGLLADGHIGQEAEQRAAPIDPPPGGRAVEAAGDIGVLMIDKLSALKKRMMSKKVEKAKAEEARA